MSPVLSLKRRIPAMRGILLEWWRRIAGGGERFFVLWGLASTCSEVPSRHEEIHTDVKEYYCEDFLVKWEERGET